MLHGFTGNCNSMRGVAHALARAGFAVELPLLPGHGTTVEDMNTTTWRDWSAAAEEALEKLEARVPGKVVVTGLSMGGSLTGWLGTRHPELAGLAFVNAAVITRKSPPYGADQTAHCVRSRRRGRRPNRHRS